MAILGTMLHQLQSACHAFFHLNFTKALKTLEVKIFIILILLMEVK